MTAKQEPRYDGYIFDLDGTIYLGEQLIPGAREKVAWIRGSGRRVVFLSNKPLEPRANYAAKLTRLGISAEPEDVVNSTQALVHYLRQHHANARLFVVGEEALVQELGQAGFEVVAPIRAVHRVEQLEQIDRIDVVVAAFDRTVDYAKLNTAHQALARGARFFATNGDRTCPVEGGEIPDCGGVIAFLEATTGRKVEMVAGKPSGHILKAALARLAAPLERCLMVGDRLATDMAMGETAGMDTALVLTGVTQPQMLESSPWHPTMVLASVADVP